MWAGFLMNDKPIRARPLKGLKVTFRLNNHEVDIKKGFRASLQSLYHVRPERNWWDEGAIHHIHVKPVSSGGDHIIHLLSEPRDIGGKDRGGNNNWRVSMGHREVSFEKARKLSPCEKGTRAQSRTVTVIETGI
jgi:hypothetical protein